MHVLKQNQMIGIVVAQFNEFITERLLTACLDELKKIGVKQTSIKVVRVPGAFEIPVTALKLAQQDIIAAVICLGAVIKGETFHYELVAQESARGVGEVALLTGKPIIFEILSADTVQLCQDRATENGINKGRDAAQAALEMIGLFNEM